MSTDQHDYRYEISADIDAPVAKVWEAWTDGEQYETWSRSVPGSVAQDVRPGGKWRATVAAPDGREFPITGTYLDVVEHERLDMAMDAPEGEPEAMRLEFTDLGSDRTRLTISQASATQKSRDRSKQGSQMLLDWCAAYVTGN
ncbi:SRPBCC domain-containing protein [Glycomyces halotolerans]